MRRHRHGVPRDATARELKTRVAAAFPIGLVPDTADARILERLRGEAMAGRRARRGRRPVLNVAVAGSATLALAAAIAVWWAAGQAPAPGPAPTPHRFQDRPVTLYAPTEGATTPAAGAWSVAGADPAPDYLPDHPAAGAAGLPPGQADRLKGLSGGAAGVLSLKRDSGAAYGDPATSVSSAATFVPFRVLVPTDTRGSLLRGVYVTAHGRTQDPSGGHTLTLVYDGGLVIRERSGYPYGPEIWVRKTVGELGPLATATSVRGGEAVKVRKGAADLARSSPTDPDGVAVGGSSVSWIEDGALYSVASSDIGPDELLVIARSMVEPD